MQFTRLRGFSALWLLAALTSCGGGTGGSGSGPVTVAPTPTPTPTPTPPPTPPSSVAISVVAAGPLGDFVLIDKNMDGIFGNAGDTFVATSPTGETQTHTLTSNGSALLTGGFDTVTGVKYALMDAPPGATVVSPLSSVVAAAGSEAAVRTGLGIDAGSDPLRSSLSILTFNPFTALQSGNADIRHDGARLTAFNIQLLNMAVLLRQFSGDPVDYSVSLDESSPILATMMRDLGPLDFKSKAMLLEAVNRSPYKVTSPSQRDMIAQMLSNYFSVMPSTISDEATARAWVLAFRFVIIPYIRSPGFPTVAPNPPYPVITQQEVLQWVQYFMTAPKPNVGAFKAVTDYRDLAHWSTPSYTRELSGDCGHGTDLPTCNDEGPEGTAWLNSVPLSEIMSVQSSDPQALSVTLSPQGKVTMSRVGGFVGMTYFTYTARLSGGTSSTGRVYVRVWPTP